MNDDGFNYFTKHDATRNIDVGTRTRDFVRGGTSVQDTSAGRPAGIYMMHGQWTLSCIGGNLPGVFLGPAFGASYALAHTEDDNSEKPIEMVNWLMASEWADSLGANIISSSLGYFAFPDSGVSLTYAQLDGHTSIITRAVEIAAAKGILVVNSAGNSGNVPNTLIAPADADGDSMLAVGAVDSTGAIAGFSSNGPTADGRIKPDLVAKGFNDWLASASGTPSGYTELSGTSFSCPLTAGVAACLMQARPRWTNVQVVHALKLTAARASHPDNQYGWGEIDALAALNWDTAGVVPSAAPVRFALLGANPLRSGATARLRFGIGAVSPAARGQVNVIDALGRRVRALWNGWLVPGAAAEVTWAGTDDAGRAVRPGLYFATFTTGSDRSVVRLALLR